MSRARVARRIATAAAYGGGGISLLGGVTVGLLLTEAQLARRQIGINDGEPPVADGTYGGVFTSRPRPSWRLAVLGDSTAAGLGVHRPEQTPGALLASGLAAASERPVDLRNVALSGAQSDDLARQVSRVLTDPEDGRELPRGELPDVCVVMIGANDVTGRVSAARSVRYLSEAVTRLRTAGCQVVVATCPDLGTVEPVPQPLRWVARRMSRQLAAAQTIAVVELGGRTVSLGSLLGPEFAAHPQEMFGPDRYHPSAEGYLTAAMAILPTLCAAVDVWPAEERARPSRRARVLPVERAAARAVSEGGTEVASPGTERPRDPWALLKHRRRRRIPAGGPEQTAAPDETAEARAAEAGGTEAGAAEAGAAEAGAAEAGAAADDAAGSGGSAEQARPGRDASGPRRADVERGAEPVPDGGPGAAGEAPGETTGAVRRDTDHA